MKPSRCCLVSKINQMYSRGQIIEFIAASTHIDTYICGAQNTTKISPAKDLKHNSDKTSFCPWLPVVVVYCSLVEDHWLTHVDVHLSKAGRTNQCQSQAVVHYMWSTSISNIKKAGDISVQDFCMTLGKQKSLLKPTVKLCILMLDRKVCVVWHIHMNSGQSSDTELRRLELPPTILLQLHNMTSRWPCFTAVFLRFLCTAQQWTQTKVHFILAVDLNLKG